MEFVFFNKRVDFRKDPFDDYIVVTPTTNPVKVKDVKALIAYIELHLPCKVLEIGFRNTGSTAIKELPKARHYVEVILDNLCDDQSERTVIGCITEYQETFTKQEKELFRMHINSDDFLVDVVPVDPHSIPREIDIDIYSYPVRKAMKLTPSLYDLLCYHVVDIIPHWRTLRDINEDRDLAENLFTDVLGFRGDRYSIDMNADNELCCSFPDNNPPFTVIIDQDYNIYIHQPKVDQFLSLLKIKDAIDWLCKKGFNVYGIGEDRDVG